MEGSRKLFLRETSYPQGALQSVSILGCLVTAKLQLTDQRFRSQKRGGRPWAAAWEWKKSSGHGVACHGTWPPGSMLPFSLVLYDACPKSLRSGVWWPQTKFGVLATVPCPRGALGEYVVCSILAEGGAGLFSDCCSLLFHQVGWLDLGGE